MFCRWTLSILPLLFAIWFCFLGPGNLLIPMHVGFRAISTGHLTIYVEDSIPQTTVTQATSGARAAEEQNCAFWGEPPGGIRPIAIYLCSSRWRWFQLGLCSDGNALTAGSSILLYPRGIVPRYLPAIIGVEMSHAFATQHFGWFSFSRLPCWAEEGLATHLGAPAWSAEALMNAPLAKQAVPELSAMGALNNRLQWTSAYESHPPVSLMYAHARAFAEYLIGRYGVDRFKRFLDQTSFLTRPSNVFASVYGISLDDADQAWLASAILSKHVPNQTRLRVFPISPWTAATMLLQYLALAFFAVWLVRQAFWASRFAWRLNQLSAKRRAFSYNHLHGQSSHRTD